MDEEHEHPIDDGPSGGDGGDEPDTSPNTWRESLDGLDYSGDTWPQKIFKFFFPFAAPAVIFTVLYTMIEYGKWLQLGTLAILYLIPPAGKESIIPAGIGLDFNMWTMAGLIFMVDVVCALFISWNFPIAKKIPLLGQWIGWIERKGSKLMEGNPSLKAGAWIGLVLFVMVPFQGSGGLTSSIIGRAVGMRSAYVASAVGIGAIIAGLLIGAAATAGAEALRFDLVLGVVLILLGILAALASLMAFRLYRIRKWEEMDGDA